MMCEKNAEMFPGVIIEDISETDKMAIEKTLTATRQSPQKRNQSKRPFPSPEQASNNLGRLVVEAPGSLQLHLHIVRCVPSLIS